MKPSTEHALALLRAAGLQGITSGDFADNYLLSYSQRIGDLKRAGYVIERERVENSSQYRWNADWRARVTLYGLTRVGK